MLYDMIDWCMNDNMSNFPDIWCIVSDVVLTGIVHNVLCLFITATVQVVAD